VANNPPRRIDIKGQDHMLAYITPEEGGILQLLGGSGAPGPMGIPSFYGPGGPGDDGTDPSDTSTDDVGTEEDPGPSFSGVNVGGGYNSNTISNAMAASSPTGIGAGFGTSGSTNMGLDDSIASMANAMAGHTAGTTGYGNVQGSINYSPVGKIGYDPFGLMQNMMNKHARGSLSKGQQPSFGKDTLGNITSVTGPGGPSVGIPGTGIVGLAANIGNMMGATTTTGYGMDTEDTGLGGGDGDNYIRPIRPYQLPTNPYNRNEYKGTELPTTKTVKDYITRDPTVQDPNAERDYNLSQGLNEGYDFAKSPFAGMNINDTQLLTAPKEFSGVSSLDPLGAQDVYSNVTNDNMVKSYQDSAKGLGSVGTDLRANKGYGM
jgi:hypothetical protein